MLPVVSTRKTRSRFLGNGAAALGSDTSQRALSRSTACLTRAEPSGGNLRHHDRAAPDHDDTAPVAECPHGLVARARHHHSAPPLSRASLPSSATWSITTCRRSPPRTWRASRSGTSAASREDRANYATIEHAGKPHKGKTTDAEKRLVREHLDEINERLAAQNLRTISLTDPDHVQRYGLERLAAERGEPAAGPGPRAVNAA